MIKLTTDLSQAEQLYRAHVPDPPDLISTWGFKRSVFDDGHDNVWFVYNDDALLPLQVGEVGTVEWFGGWLSEGHRWLGDPAVLTGLVQFIMPMANEMDQIEEPLIGCTDPSILPQFTMIMPDSWDTWAAGLNRRRRQEFKRTDETTTVTTIVKLDHTKCRPLLEQGLQLHLASQPEDNYYCEPHFQRALIGGLMWGAANHRLDAVIRRSKEDNSLVGLSLALSDDRVDPTYHWIFMAGRHGPSMGKALCSDMIRMATSTNCTMVNAFGDELGAHTFKTQLGFKPRHQWCIRTSVSGLRHDPEDDPDNPVDWVGNVIKRNIPGSPEALTELITLTRRDLEPNVRALDAVNHLVLGGRGWTLGTADDANQFNKWLDKQLEEEETDDD